VARAIEDLKRSGYVEARRGKGVFVAPTLPTRPSPSLRADFLKDAVIRAAALGMTPDDVAMGVLSVAGVGLAAVRGAVAVLLVECSPPELDFFGRELEAQLPVRVDKVLLRDVATGGRRPAPAGPRAAGRGRGLVGPTVPVIGDDRALNQRAIQMLGAILGEHDGDGGPPALPPPARRGRSPRLRSGPTPATAPHRGDGEEAVRRRHDPMVVAAVGGLP